MTNEPKKQKDPFTKPVQPQKVSEHIFDRDKNISYVPNDESILEIIDENNNPEIIHPNHMPIRIRAEE